MVLHKLVLAHFLCQTSYYILGFLHNSYVLSDFLQTYEEIL